MNKISGKIINYDGSYTGTIEFSDKIESINKEKNSVVKMIPYGDSLWSWKLVEVNIDSNDELPYYLSWFDICFFQGFIYWY